MFAQKRRLDGEGEMDPITALLLAGVDSLINMTEWPVHTTVCIKYGTPHTTAIYTKSKVSPCSVIILPTLLVPTILSSFIASYLENITLTAPLPGSSNIDCSLFCK